MLGTEQNYLEASDHIRGLADLDSVLLYLLSATIRKYLHSHAHFSYVVNVSVFDACKILTEPYNVLVTSLAKAFSYRGHVYSFKKIRLALRILAKQYVRTLAEINVCRFYITKILDRYIFAEH